MRARLFPHRMRVNIESIRPARTQTNRSSRQAAFAFVAIPFDSRTYATKADSGPIAVCVLGQLQSIGYSAHPEYRPKGHETLLQGA